jgi:hypothetical protein
MPRPRVAIVGGGIAGLASAWLLQHDHEVRLYEREQELGGHARTVPVPCDGITVPVETGFKYFMDGSHEVLLGLMRLLGLRPEKRKGSLTIADRVHDRTMVLPPRSPRHLWRLATGGQLGLALGLRRFLASADRVVAGRDWSATLGDHAAALGLGEPFVRELLLPLCASSWGASLELMAAFPAYDVLKNLWKGPTGFYELPGGVSSYIAALAARLQSVTVRLGRPVQRVCPGPDGAVTIEHGDARESFDHVVVATPAWTAARLLAGLPEAAPLVAALREFRSFDTRVFIHEDASFMPASRSDWSVINHVFERDHRVMTEWSGHHLARPVFRSWVPAGAPEPARVHARKDFQHLVVSRQHAVLQRRLEEGQGLARVWLAGMYTTDVDDHESALVSAVRIARLLAPDSPSLRQLGAIVPRRHLHAAEASPGV